VALVNARLLQSRLDADGKARHQARLLNSWEDVEDIVNDRPSCRTLTALCAFGTGNDVR